jgi:hypothetical protein
MKKICVLLALCSLCGCAMLPSGGSTASIHLHDSPQNANGFSSGINPDTIRVIAGGAIVPRGELVIAKVADPRKKADPGSPNDEFVVSVNARVSTLTYGEAIHLFVRDNAGNLTAYRLDSKSDGGSDWRELVGSDAANLYSKHFDHLKRRRAKRNATPEYELTGEHGGLLVKDGKVVCGWGEGPWRLHTVIGGRLQELRSLGLEHVAKAECLIWGTVDNNRKTIEIRDYKIRKIYPKR